MKYLPLQAGNLAIVDDEDYPRLKMFKWSSTGSRNKRWQYAHRYNHLTDEHHYMAHDVLRVPNEIWIDHINGNTLDNRKCNLRICINSQNQANRRKSDKFEYSSKYKGVYRQGRKWVAQIIKFGKTYRLGTFDTEESAAAAYNEKAKELFGEFARLNSFD